MSHYRFDNRGNLTPYELILIDELDEFERFFVSEFRLSVTRPLLFAGLLDYLSAMGSLLEIVDYQGDWLVWIDGSFTTSNPNPNDVDVLNVFKDDPVFEKNKSLFAPLAGSHSRNLYGVDAYFWLTAPTDESQELGIYWREQFGTDHEGFPKGIIQLAINLGNYAP